MFFPEPSLRVFKRDSFAAVELFHALTDRGYGLGTLQPVEQGLIAVGSSARPLTVSTSGVFFSLSRPT
jgi:hypothetical protein